jgi:uncharacterized protein (TIGR04222 family)
MNPKNTELLARIEGFSFDEPGTSFTFAQRLARENGWPAEFTRRVLSEYRRFAYLAMAAGHAVCPSEAVDQAWHQHLTFTQNYWEDFCGKVLERPLHHGPTRGGRAEATKHHDMYARTLASYRAHFGEEPPADIWPTGAERFGEGASYVRVNRRQAWIIPKPRWLRPAVLRPARLWLVVLAGVVLAGCRTTVGAIPLFDWRGPDFLAFYIGALLTAVFVVLGLRSRARGSESWVRKEDVSSDPYLVATLTGGPNLAIYAAMSELGRRELVTATGPETIRAVAGTPAPADLHPFESAVYRSLSNQIGSMVALRSRVSVETEAMRSLLEQQELVLPESRRQKLARQATWIFGVLVALGVVKLLVGIDRSKPVFWLVFLLIVAVTLLVRMRRTPYRTRRGEAAWNWLHGSHVRPLLHRQVFDPQFAALGLLPLAVGLYGVPFLNDSPLSSFGTSIVPRNEVPKKNGDTGWWLTGCGSGCSSAGCSGDGTTRPSSTGGDSSSNSSGDSSGGSSGCSSGSSGCSSGCGGCGGGGD